jgi:hypothetical protein
MYSLGDVPFTADSDWNQLVAQDATYTKLNWPASTGYNYSVNWDHYSPALYVASSSDPLVQVKVPASWGHPGGTITVRMPTSATGAVGTDGELLVIDGDKVYNFWQFKRTSATTATAASYAWTDVDDGDGWGTKQPFKAAGITAVGSSMLGGLLVEAETDKGEINHALQLVVDSKLVKSGFTGGAIAGDGGSASGIVREGDHLAIKPGTPMPAGLSELGQKVFRAMQKYGAYVVDVAGGTTVIRAQANAYDSATMNALWKDMDKIIPKLDLVTGGTIPGTVDPTPPATTQAILSSIAANGTGITNGNGTLSSGTVRFTLGFSKAVNVTGTPTLNLNDGGVAKYVSGSGSRNLVFEYQIGAGQNTSDLAVSTFNLSGVKDTSGNAVSLTNAPKNPAGTLVIDTNAPTLSTITASGNGITNGSGTLKSGTVRLSLAFNEAVNVSGTPSLTLNNGGTAKYVSGSGTKTLVFDYQIAAGQNTSDLAVSTFNLSGVKDIAGNAISLTNAPKNPAGTLKIDTTPPPSGSTTEPTTLSRIAASGTGITSGNGTLGSGTVRLTLGFSGAVNVTGTPTLNLNDGGVAKYVSGSGSKNLVFEYQIGAGQNTSDLAVTTFNLGGVKDTSGNAVSLTNAPKNPAGTLTIDTKAPTLSSIIASGTGITNGNGTLKSGVVRLSLAFNEAVKVSGTPSLTLNDGGVAKYVSGSGSKTLVFDYQIASGQNTSDLRVRTFNLGGVKDAAGNSVNLTDAPKNPDGRLVIDTQRPTLSAITASGKGITNGAGTLTSGTVRLSLTFDEAVKVSGSPSLKLNSGGVATYAGGSGTKTLTFDYRIAAGENTSNLAVTSYDLGTVKDLAGNRLNLANAPTNPPGRLKIVTADAPTTTPQSDDLEWLLSRLSSSFGFGSGSRTERADLSFGAQTTLAYDNNAKAAVDTSAKASVTDGSNMAKLQLFGQYIASAFATTANSTGGTTIHDAHASSLVSTLTKSS